MKKSVFAIMMSAAMLLSLCACNVKEGADENEEANVVNNIDALSSAATVILSREDTGLDFEIRLPDGMTVSSKKTSIVNLFDVIYNGQNYELQVSKISSGTELCPDLSYETYKYYSIAIDENLYYLAWNINGIGYLVEHQDPDELLSVFEDYIIENADENTGYTKEKYGS